jgi:hypothetical protein
MPVLDDAFLGTLFEEAAATFAVPPSGVDDIIRRARGDANDTGETGGDGGDGVDGPMTVGTDPDGAAPAQRRLGGAVRSHRLLAVAAAVIVVAVIAGVSFTLGHRSTGSARVATQSATGVPAPGPLTSTTVPTTRHGAVGGPFGTSAPAVTPSTAVNQGPANASTSAGSPLKAPGGAVPTQTAPAGPSAKIVQTGTLVMQVPKGAVASTVTALSALATQVQGMVATSHLKTNVAAPQGSVTLQVPVASFSSVVHRAEAMGRSQKLTTKAKDVTGSYVDLQSRITALEASRQQYLTILAKATSISDILAVQAQLDNLQSQIEQLQGQLALVTNETTYSSLTVMVHAPPPAHQHRAATPTGIDRAWHDSLHGFADGVDGAIGLAGPLLFALLVAGVVLLAGRLLWRRWQRHNL